MIGLLGCRGFGLARAEVWRRERTNVAGTGRHSDTYRWLKEVPDVVVGTPAKVTDSLFPVCCRLETLLVTLKFMIIAKTVKKNFKDIKKYI